MSAQNLILIVVVIAVFYFLMIMPQRRQQKKRNEMMQQMGPGAEVLTAGGLYGKIVSMNDDKYVVQIASGVEVTMDQRSIVRVVESAPAQISAAESGSTDESTSAE